MALYACLVRLLKEGKIESQVLEADKFFFGRSPDSAILMPDQSISRQHLSVVIKNGKTLIKDMASSNGTLIDGKPIAPETAIAIEPHQKIRLGKSEIVFTLEAIPRRINLKNIENLNLNDESKSQLEEVLRLANEQIKNHEKEVEKLFEKVKKEREQKELLTLQESQRKAEGIIQEANVTAKSIVDGAYKSEAEIMLQAEKNAQKQVRELQEQAENLLKNANEKSEEIEKGFQDKGKKIIDEAKASAKEILENAKKSVEEIKIQTQKYCEDKRKEAHQVFDKIVADAETEKNEIILIAKKDSENIKIKAQAEADALLNMHDSQFLNKVKNFEEECEIKRKILNEDLRKETEELAELKNKLADIKNKKN